MTTVPTHAAHAFGHLTLKGLLTKPERQAPVERRPVRIDAEEFSDHMLRDIGMIDGRPARGERPATDDLGSLFRDGPKRFV
ncbi:MAG: hypothetical protein AAAB35_03840 [Phyllobacterium sp.]|uniref:hypothetical protein n=1 Tax=Phyllobacterium sp. TaxID=1871046 RepID=UPI0030F0BBC9